MRKLYLTPLIALSAIGLIAMVSGSANALMTTENPKSNSYGIEGKISSPPPTQGAYITAPSGGQSYNSSPITISGSCPRGLLVEVYDNGVLVGSTMCQNGSFSLQISLFPGQNDLTAIVLDDLGQKGPASNTVSVAYTSASFGAFASYITLTSSYGRRAADPGSQLTWPLQLSGGTGPYAFSIDWGDGSAPDLQSQAVAGIVNIKHTYKKAGIYRVTIKVTDANGSSGFLQLIAVANGAASSAVQTGDEQTAATKVVETKILWEPMVILSFFVIIAFWLGRRYEMRALRNKLERDAAMIKKLNI